ncbi:MAG TPA: hypothetical protein VL356_11670 [Acidocella sp.]|nr:hypothetical protein [Acidocella sp.]
MKKAAQKLFCGWAKGVVAATALGPAVKSFFASFCSQKEAFPSLPLSVLLYRVGA